MPSIDIANSYWGKPKTLKTRKAHICHACKKTIIKNEEAWAKTYCLSYRSPFKPGIAQLFLRAVFCSRFCCSNPPPYLNKLFENHAIVYIRKKELKERIV